MLRLHGFASSNYHNVVKLALIEKGIVFEEVSAYPPADEAFKSKNPTGRFPCLETEDGQLLGESKVILNYLEEVYPEVRLLPADPLDRARVRELMEVIDLYLEWPARRLYPESLFDEKVSDEVKSSARLELLRGVAGLEERGRFAPYIAGPEFSLADCSAAIHLPMVSYSFGFCSRSSTVLSEDPSSMTRTSIVTPLIFWAATRPNSSMMVASSL